MISRPVRLLSVAASLAIAACATIATAPADTLQLAAPRAVVYDSGGVPQFEGGRDYILAVAGNTAGTIYASTVDMVRVSEGGAPELWVRCGDLREPVGQCAAAGAATPAMKTRTLPICPGDPRCPRPRKK